MSDDAVQPTDMLHQSHDAAARVRIGVRAKAMTHDELVAEVVRLRLQGRRLYRQLPESPARMLAFHIAMDGGVVVRKDETLSDAAARSRALDAEANRHPVVVASLRACGWEVNADGRWERLCRKVEST